MGAIDKSREQRLRACEAVLIESMEKFVKVGLALKEIREDALFRECGFKSFVEYLKSNENRFGIKKTYAYDLISSAELRVQLPIPRTAESEWTEWSVRELRRLPADSKAKAVAARVVKEVETSGEPLTVGIVRKHVDKELGVKRGGSAPPRPKPSLNAAVRAWVGQFEGIADKIDTVPDDALALFGAENPLLSKNLADAIERLQTSLARCWANLP